MSRNQQSERNRRPFVRFLWIGLILLGIGMTLASYLFVDSTVCRWLTDHDSNWYRNVWVDGLRQAGKGGVPIWLMLAWSCLTNRWRPTFTIVLALILVAVSVIPLKTTVRRSRPNTIVAASQPHDPSELRSADPPKQNASWRRKVSFPSGDTAVVFASAMTVSVCLRGPWMPILFTVAGFIGVLRVITLAHYPSDVVAGATIGMLCGLMALRWTAGRRDFDEFHLQLKGRVVTLLVLVFIVPFVSPYLGMGWLKEFLHVYLIPLTVLALVYVSVSRLWAGRKSSPPPRAAEVPSTEDSGAPPQMSALRGPA